MGDRCRYVHSLDARVVAGASAVSIQQVQKFGDQFAVCRDVTCELEHDAEGNDIPSSGNGYAQRQKGAGRGKGGGWKGAKQAPVATAFSSEIAKALNGPYLGQGSELRKMWTMPDGQGHNDSIAAAALLNDGMCTGGLDRRLIMWRGEAGQDGLALKLDKEVEFAAGISSLLYDAATKWCFVGLMDGTIKVYRQEPLAEATLQGHTGHVSAFVFHEGVLLSGSQDSSVRAWKIDAASGSFQCAASVDGGVGPILALSVEGSAAGLFLAGEQGISCVSLQSMQPVGRIGPHAPVVGLVSYEGLVIASYSNGVIKAFDGTGAEKFSHGPIGEHTTNTAVALMRHPFAGKIVLLCGQALGYVTAYDLPDFKPRGTFSSGYQGDVTAIVDMVSDGMFLTCGFSGDVTIWRWENNGSVSSVPAQLQM